jgi:hypothetical protein
VCVSCFKAGGHGAHSYTMYRSVAGGCCDCGDLSSWRAEGEGGGGEGGGKGGGQAQEVSGRGQGAEGFR